MNTTNNWLVDFSKIKATVLIEDILSVFTEIVKDSDNSYRAIKNPIRVEETSTLFIYPNTQRYHILSDDSSGDVIDLIKELTGFCTISPEDAIDLLESYSLIPIKRSDISPYTHDIKRGGIWVDPYLEKLFDRLYIPIKDISQTKYLFKYIIGYDKEADCPTIIIRDTDNIIVDIVKYQPTTITRTTNNRSSYLYFLQAQVEKLIATEEYAIVGEGFKSAINAYIAAIPFISIDSISNIKTELKTYLTGLKNKGIPIVGAFDGNSTGERAYQEIRSFLPIDNLFDFNSNLNFMNYLIENKRGI
jgi:hypothetical protein